MDFTHRDLKSHLAWQDRFDPDVSGSGSAREVKSLWHSGAGYDLIGFVAA